MVIASTENPVVSALSWSAGAGALTFHDVRYLLIRPETLMQFQRAVESEVGPVRAGELLYSGGFSGGHLSGRRYKEAFGLSPREAVEFMCRMGGEIGWGRFELEALDVEHGRLVVTVHNSVFAQAGLQLPTFPEPLPCCHLIRGVLGGLMSGLYGTRVQARELACLAQGAAACRFEVERQA